ncbi:MAG TPA: AbrB/MazE/SpoVT family DNA-binding domain-containing protein [Caulobacteraceae bacterium]|nr:AbrB/MazE/SpoVT family DNA-binding domain-containing protein [Caulobacteraceae bacterium]
MPEPKSTTVLSTKGQVILPKAVRERRGWRPGARLVVQETPEGVLLTEEPAFPRTRPEDVFGCLKYDGPPKTVEEMEAGLAEAFRNARDLDRY